MAIITKEFALANYEQELKGNEQYLTKNVELYTMLNKGQEVFCVEQNYTIQMNSSGQHPVAVNLQSLQLRRGIVGKRSMLPVSGRLMNNSINVIRTRYDLHIDGRQETGAYSFWGVPDENSSQGASVDFFPGDPPGNIAFLPGQYMHVFFQAADIEAHFKALEENAEIVLDQAQNQNKLVKKQVQLVREQFAEFVNEP